jgi:hypothetical protein
MKQTAQYPLVSGDSEAHEAMATAFEAAWAALCSSGERRSAQQACDARICLARAILDCVREGERNVARLSASALESLESLEPHWAGAANRRLYL